MRGKDCDNMKIISLKPLSRLLNKVEDLERLMNDEVTDINEILNVINTIQVQISRSTKVDIFINLIFSG